MINNNTDDYLWDQSGEPDPEIQELEQVLGTLRYQPRPLEIPLGIQPERRHVSARGFAPRLAIAAAIALVVLGAGWWLSLQRRDSRGVATTDKPAASANSDQAAVTVTPDVQRELKTPDDSKEEAGSLSITPADKPNRKRFNQAGLAGATKRRRDLEVKQPELTAYELHEAEAGKARLMLALRVASAKLNFAVKKAQGNQGNLIQNQHKVG